MARVDDYTAAFELAASQLSAKDPAQVAELAGAELAPDGLRLNFVGQDILVGLDPVTVTIPDGPEVSLTDQVLVLHYLNTADGRPVTGEWIAYREIPGAQSYHAAFYKRAMAPLKSGFGEKPDLLPELAKIYNARPGEGGDASVIVQAFPRVPLMLQVWAGDEDFPAEAVILLDKSVAGYLSAEDVAWVGGRVVYPLVGMAFKAKEK